MVFSLGVQYIACRMPVPTETTQIDRRSARQAVFERLRSWIENGVLAPGEVLKDGEIADQLGVSRTPVREALQMLERHGAVEVLPGRLTRVTPIGPQAVAELYAPLGALMACAAETAARRADRSHVAAMTEHNQRLRRALTAGDPVAAREADRAFHDVVLGLADNAYLVTAIEPLLLHARRLETLYFRETELGLESCEEHSLIIDAIAAGDSTRAGTLMRHNYTRFWTPSAAAEHAPTDAPNERT